MESKDILKSQAKDILENIKSKYILKRLFDNLPKNTALKIVKYNKNKQNRLNLNINNYKEFNLIEIELIPTICENCRFINIENKEDISYYHIFFNNEKKEIKSHIIPNYGGISKIRIIIDYQVKLFHKLFYNCCCIEYIYFKKSYRKNITDMSYMFCGCLSLKKLDLSNLNTSNVTDMNNMFFDCLSLDKYNQINFNTTNFNCINLKNMSLMFAGCESLVKLNLSMFKTNNVNNMCLMFSRCYKLKNLDISSFNTNNVTNMSGMFKECSSLIELNLSNFNTN